MKSFYSRTLVILTSILSVSVGSLLGQTTTYSSVGTFSYVVPAGVTGVCVDLAGGQGGNSYSGSQGGKGGRIQATIAVTPGMTLSVYVGGQGSAYTGCSNTGGANGSGGGAGGGTGACEGGGGGGSSDIRIGGTALSNRVVVAAGGGGAGGFCADGGGAGGGATGSNGTYCGSYSTCCSGGGAGASAAGAGASFGGSTTNGGLGFGGNGTYYGAAGGGGYYGGGGGYYGSGAGGSSYPATGGSNTYASAVTNTSAFQAGNGYVAITAPNLGTISGNVPLCTGQSMNLTPSVTGGTWSSANTAIATVSSTGHVTAVSSGTVNLTYTATAACGSGYIIVPVLVNPAPAPVGGPTTACPGSSVTLTDTSSGGVWSSTNTAVAIINSSGVVSGLSAGTTSISYTLGSTGCASVILMTVNPLPPAVTGTASVCAGGSVTTLSDVSPGGSWASGTPSVATVTGTGVVTGVGAGTSIITYTLPTGCSTTRVVTVNPLPGSIGGGTIVCAGSSITLSDAGGGTWSSSNSAIAAITPSSGVVTGVSAGTPTITYTLPTGCFTTTNILVNPVPAPITGTANVCEGGTTTLADVTPGGIWTSSSTTYATVLPVTGAVTGVSAGTPTISYVLGTGCAATRSLVVNALPIPYTVTGGGGYCVGASGVHVGLSFGATGINYKLFNGTTLVSTVSGSNSGLDFGLQSATGTYTVMAIDATTACSNSMTGSTTVSVNPLPAVFNVAGGGTFCAGATGPNVTLSGSDPSVNYQLFNGSSPVGGALSGTGSSLSFGAQSAGGSYTAVATNPTTGCSINMTGSALVSVNALPNVYAMSAGGGYCIGGTGVDVRLSGSDASTTYQLFYGGTATGSPVAGTGSSVDFGLHTSAGIYTVSAINSAGCTNNMSGTTTIMINPLPTVYSVTGGGAYCAGGAGSHVGVSFSATGVNYQLFRGSVPVGSPLSGTNSGLDFGPQTTVGTYSVVATDQVTGCSQNMSGTAAVSTNALPAAFTVTGGGGYCAGTAGVHVGLAGSATGVHYQLYNGTSTVGSGVNGTGSPLDFGLQAGAGSYTVVATNVTTACVNNMTGTATVVVNMPPNSYLVSGSGTSYCAGGTGIDVTLGGSDVTARYQLYRGSTAVGSPMIGTGGLLDFLNQTTPGTYTITATDLTSGCSHTMTGSAPIAINALPTRFSVTGGGGYCPGSVGVHIGLSSTNSGISYQLYNSSGFVGSSMSGVGSSIDFGYNTTPDNYSVIATNIITGCTDTMNGAATVSVNSLPAAYNVTGGGSYCFGGSGIVIGLDNSDTGVSYQLYMGSTASGSSVSGLGGSAISFGTRLPAGTYTVMATDNTTHCSAPMNLSASVSILPLPGSHSVTGGGTYCSGGTGVNVNLDGSDIGVNYILYLSGSALDTVGGSGSSIGFGMQTGVGAYNVIAIDGATLCQTNMTGTATVSTLPSPAAQTVTGGGAYCAGGTGVNVGIGGTESGIVYRLLNGTTPVGADFTGTGSAHSFGLQTAAGVYTIVASPGGLCQTTMTGAATVTVQALPNAYTMTGGGSYCNGLPGVNVGLSNSDAGITYSLYRGATLVTSMPGSGAALNFGAQTTPGVYTTSATDSSTGCMSAVGTSGSATIAALPLPAAFNVTGGGHYCTGGAGVHVTLAGSNTDVNYQLYQGGTAVGSVMAGTGTLLDFGVFTTGSYTVKGTDAATSCMNAMSDTAVVTADPLLIPTGVTITQQPASFLKQQRDTLVANATNAGTDPLYQWYSKGFPISGATNRMLISRNFATGDSISVVVTSNGGNCGGYTGGAAKVLTVLSNVGVAQVESNIDVRVMPNPNNGSFSIVGSLGSIDDQDVAIEVTDLLGHVVYSGAVAARNGEINKNVQLNAGIANGMYILSVRSGSESKVFHVVVAK